MAARSVTLHSVILRRVILLSVAAHRVIGHSMTVARESVLTCSCRGAGLALGVAVLPLGLHPPLAALSNQLLCVGVPCILCILCAVAPVRMMRVCLRSLRCSAFALRNWLCAQVPATGHAVYVETTEVARVWEHAVGPLLHGWRWT